jgi:hypothetical protein
MEQTEMEENETVPAEHTVIAHDDDDDNNNNDDQMQPGKDIEKLKEKLNENYKRVNIMLKRTDELLDVKQYIRQMNDIIKDDIFYDIGSFAIILKQKVDQFSEDIKEKLKQSYTLVKDRHTELSKSIQHVKGLIEKNILVDDDALLGELMSTIDAKLDETEVNLGMTNCGLYPNLKYSLDTKHINDALTSLKLTLYEDMIDANNNESHQAKLTQLKEKFGRLVEVENNSVFECTVTSGLSDYGICWIQISNRQVMQQQQ